MIDRSALFRFRHRMDLGDPRWTDERWLSELEKGNPAALEVGGLPGTSARRRSRRRSSSKSRGESPAAWTGFHSASKRAPEIQARFREMKERHLAEIRERLRPEVAG